MYSVGFIMIRRDAVQIIEGITSCLAKNTDIALSPSEIARKTGIHYESVKRYVKVIEDIQKAPSIETIKTPKGELYKAKGLLFMPEDERLRYIRKKYMPEPREKDMMLVKLYKNKAFNAKNALMLKQNKIIEEGLRFKHFAKTKDGKIYLTELGKKIAEGALKMFY